MLLNVFSRMLDNGFSFTRAFKDEWRHRKNIKNFETNLVEYKKLLNNFIGYNGHEYELFGEYSYSITFYHADYIIIIYLDDIAPIGSDSNRNSIKIIKNAEEPKESLASWIAETIQSINSYHIKIINNDAQTIRNVFNDLEGKEFKGEYIDINKIKEETIDKLVELNIIKSK